MIKQAWLITTESGAHYEIRQRGDVWELYRVGPAIKHQLIGGSIENRWVTLQDKPDPWPPRNGASMHLRPVGIEPVDTSPVDTFIADTPGS